MSDYRFSIGDHNGIQCLHVMIDGGQIAETHIPVDDLLKAMHRARLVPGVNRIKISTGTRVEVGHHTICLPAYLTQSCITDAETGQGLFFVSGIEIFSDTHGNDYVKLVVDPENYILDCHITHDLSLPAPLAVEGVSEGA